MTGDGEDDLRHWLVDYLVTTIGCSPDKIAIDVPFNNLGVGSRDGVVLAGELSELLARPVSPVDIWQNPTIAGLAHALTHPEAEATRAAESGSAALAEPIAIIGCGMRLPGKVDNADALFDFLDGKREGRCRVPSDRYNIDAFYASNKNGHVGTEHG